MKQLSALLVLSCSLTWGHEACDSIRQHAVKLQDLHAKAENSHELVFPFGHAKRTTIDFFPLAHHSDIGVTLGELNHEGVMATHELLRALLSGEGYLRFEAIRDLEDVLKEAGGKNRERNDYAIQLFGAPAGEGPLAIKYEGHHLSLNVTVTNGTFSGTPLFMGTNPALVQSGPQEGRRALAEPEDLGRALLESLSDEQRSVVLQKSKHGIQRGGALPPVGELKGLAWTSMDAAQQKLLLRIIDSFAKNLRTEIGYAEWARIKGDGLENLHFLWSGSTEKGNRYFWRIQGPSVLIEFQAVNANHMHALWRNPRNDFGANLLNEHLKHGH